MATTHNGKSSDPNKLSRVICRHLNTLGERTEAGAGDSLDAYAAAHALEDLLKPELEAFNDLMGSDDIYPSATMGYGVKFGIEATLAILQNPSKAHKTITRLFSELKADMHSRMSNARQL